MAIQIATIQMRRGLKNDFDPQKMLPGEWAVSIDTDTESQIIWMCFRAGVVKRMGTYEDFKAQIEEATDDIRAQYETIFNEIKAYMEGLAQTTENYKAAALVQANRAEESADNAAESAAIAIQKAEAASSSADEAAESADESDYYKKLSESYARGGTGIRPNEDVDSAEFYYEQAKRISQGLEGALMPMGTIAFAQLSVATKQAGYMYNILDDFTTDSTFKEGAGYTYSAGTNVYYTADGYWDCLAGTMVAGVKGEAESIYRRGFVDITKENIGLANIDTQVENLEERVKLLEMQIYSVPSEFNLLSRPPIDGNVGQTISFICTLNVKHPLSSRDYLNKAADDITWTSSNSTICKVTGHHVNTRDNKNGSLYVNVTLYKAGTATVTGTTSNGMTVSCEIVSG